MKESFCLFKTLVHSKWFKETSVILFLNKTDILKEKIQYSDLVNYDETYEGILKCILLFVIVTRKNFFYLSS